MWLFCAILYWMYFVNIIDAVNSKFGPFYIVTRSVDQNCLLSDTKDTVNGIKTMLGVYKLSRTLEEFRGEISIGKEFQITSGKITADIWRDGGYKPFYHKIFNKPCEQGLLAFMLNRFTNVDKRCFIKKGNFTISGIEPTTLLKKTVGSNFFYEKISFTMALYSKFGLTGCVKIACESRPLVTPTVPKGKKNNTKPTNINQT